MTFDPSVLSWQVSTPSAPISFTLLDSGTYDAATGDGIYTGTFTPVVTGDYTVYITATGNSSAGVPFARTTTASLEVDAPLAQLGTFTDFPVDDSDGLIKRVVIKAPVNVQVAGTYRLTLNLQGSNGKTTEASVSAQLSTGSQEMWLKFPFSNLLSLGTNGPYAEINATLLYISGSQVTMADYVANAGMMQSYSQPSISPGSLAFTGQNSATGIVTGSGSTYDLLQISIGIYNSTAGSCNWSAQLTDSSGNEISFASASGAVPAGNSSITLSFNGNLLAQSADGSYLVKNAAVQCGGPQIVAPTLFQTQSFSPSQFTFVAADFTLAVQTTPPTAAPGSAFLFRIYASSVGVLSAPINLTVSGLPSGAAASFTVPALLALGISYLKVGVALGTPAGTYPLTIRGSSGALIHSVSAVLTVSQAPIPNGTYTLTNAASDLLLTDPGAAYDSGAQMTQSTATGGPEQQWQFAYQSSGYYTIQNVSSQLYLSDPASSDRPGTQLEQMYVSGDASQLWSLSLSDGLYSISNQASGLAVDDANWSTSAGDGMDLWTPTGNANQNWSIGGVSTALPNAYYTLTNQASNLLLADPGSSPASGTQMIQWQATGGMEQLWHFVLQPSGYYTVQNVASQLFLADPGASGTLGTQLEQITVTNDDSEQWALYITGTGYSLVNKATGLAVDDPGYSDDGGTGIDLWSRNGGANQSWTITGVTQFPISNGIHTSTNGASNLLLTDPSASTASGTQIVQSNATGGPEQQWLFLFQPSGYYLIQNVSSQLYLTDPGSSGTPGTQLEQMTASGDDSQLWSVTSTGGTAYSISNKATGLAIDDASSSPNAGSGMDLWTLTGGANQNWSIQ